MEFDIKYISILKLKIIDFFFQIRNFSIFYRNYHIPNFFSLIYESNIINMAISYWNDY